MASHPMQWLFDIVIAQMEAAGFIRLPDVTAAGFIKLPDVTAAGFIKWLDAKNHIEGDDLDYVKLTHGKWIGSAIDKGLLFWLVPPRDLLRLMSLDFTIQALYRLGVGTETPAYPLHIVAAETPDSISLLLESTGALHCLFALRTPAANRNCGLYFFEQSTQRILLDYEPVFDRLRVHNYTYGAAMLYLADNGDVQLPSSYGNTVGGTNHALYIDDTGKVGQQPSSEAVKENIRDLDKSDDIYQLRPVRFDDAQGGRKDQPGLLAEEVEEIMPGLIEYSRVPVYGDVADPVSGDTIQGITHYESSDVPETVRYEDLIPHLLKEIQTLRKDLDELKAEVGEHHPS